jgi:pyrimidine deaminase RibD-like protein
VTVEIELAERCKPENPKRTPRLGVVVAVNGIIIGEAYRGSGKEGDDEHAEVMAIGSIPNKSQLRGAVVYTTLEPCTHHVRKATSKPCVELLIEKRVRKVVIGVLDPNQGICGRGVNKLQKANIEVELFPHDLAQKIREHNGVFMDAQQALSPVIVMPKDDEEVLLRKNQGGWYGSAELVIEFNNDPGPDVYLITQHGDRWYPQNSIFTRIQGTKQWKCKANFGAPGSQTLHVVQGNALGRTLVNYYRTVVETNNDRRDKLKRLLEGVETNDDRVDKLMRWLEGKDVGEGPWRDLPGSYQGIRMGSLTTGLDSLAHVTVEVKRDSE